ncbi:MAG: HD domain-containing protein [Chitinivibrionales bacterium]|nr:HD domain-containing protein [Chitinivibrionales bacterium]
MHNVSRTDVQHLHTFFADYVLGYYGDDREVNEAIKIKEDHSRRVVREMLDIADSLNLREEQRCIAEIVALLHDIGRFEQYRQYRTFADAKSKNHAHLGVIALVNHDVMRHLYSDDGDLILNVISHHNVLRIPPSRDNEYLMYLKMLRDADKIDILHVLSKYYLSDSQSRVPALELDLADDPVVSDRIFDEIVRGNNAQLKDVETLNDFKALQMAWVFDINFQRAFEIVRQRSYLKRLYESMPHSERINLIYAATSEYLERKCGDDRSVNAVR